MTTSRASTGNLSQLAEATPHITADRASEDLYLNRELTWLEFNRRVLFQAVDDRTPLLDRVRFLSIFTSNLDEFYMKRVGGLKRQMAAGVISRTPDGMTPSQQLAAIRETVLPMLTQQAEVYVNDILPALDENDIHLLEWDDLNADEREQADEFFRTHVFPALTPLAVDPGHPFPFISNLSLSLAVILRHPDRDERLFARVKIPHRLHSWVRVNEGSSAEDGLRFVSLMQIIRHNLDQLFPGMVILDVMPFRICRNADVERDDEDAEDLLEMVEQELRERRFAKVVRLEHGPNPNRWMLRFLMQELELTESDVYEMPAELDYTGLDVIADLNIPALTFESWTPLTPPPLLDDEVDIFTRIREGDFMVHHPYESFNASVERFIRSAVRDPKVIAIKMTLYRTGDDSPFIPMLIEAAEQGKQVVCLVELKARFDEERNVQLAQRLEKAGVHVVYGIVGLKTHTKTSLVVREEGDGLRCYCHIGTGNYHAGTARLYTDLGIFTCKKEFTADLVELFNFLTGRSLKRQYRKLLVAPVNMKDRFESMIQREIEHKQAGRPARIVAKMNSLEHRGITRALYQASQAGVPIDLIVRGFCCLRPQVEGLSENIRVISIIGRFLEHHRIFFFQNGCEDPHDGEYFIGSADWMYRNLLARVEAITPVESQPLRQRLWQMLEIMLNDQRQAWDMDGDGNYTLRYPADDLPPDDPARIGTHQSLMNLARQEASMSISPGKSA